MSELCEDGNICLKNGCSACCNPVKICNTVPIAFIESLPFIDLNEVLVSEEHPDSIRVKTFSCPLFNLETGQCQDYGNRPLICRNTKCRAFECEDELEQGKIIFAIQREQFLKLERAERRL